MKISDSEMDRLEFGGEELQELADLIEQIIHENSDAATGEEMRDLGILWELVFPAAKELKALTFAKVQIGPGAQFAKRKSKMHQKQIGPTAYLFPNQS